MNYHVYKSQLFRTFGEYYVVGAPTALSPKQAGVKVGFDVYMITLGSLGQAIRFCRSIDGRTPKCTVIGWELTDIASADFQIC